MSTVTKITVKIYDAQYVFLNNLIVITKRKFSCHEQMFTNKRRQIIIACSNKDKLVRFL